MQGSNLKVQIFNALKIPIGIIKSKKEKPNNLSIKLNSIPIQTM
jgi:hypothetical protein